ncbi:MAG TPA: PQQ-binding-like beta-propeller repeat protein [Polyangiales bacterium]|nr:PQQ-binding-like beta-propeller repeat protein [Polyangiales bacterium]
MDPASPWPKFRRTAMQTGRSPVLPIDSGADPWVFPTGRGIFSTAVIDGDENVYVGSGDRVFYKLDKNGNELWSVLTGEVVDSSALLDDRGALYFGSGDGFLYALDREDGSEIWSFEADPPSLNDALINWFEGNVAMGLDGTLFVPNDNRCTYAIDRDDGTDLWCFVTDDQTWSLPALNPETERLFMGSNYPLADNVFGIQASNGSQAWGFSVRGTVAASPMIASTDPDGLVAVGGFDGFLYGLRQSDGSELWSYGARDHIYASPAQTEDGTIIQPSADGTIYAIDPADGSLRWAYDTREPIRSSPAIDGDGNIYVGSGEGQMFVLNPDGSLRWSIQLIDDERDDLNSSPALGKELVVISGESGEVFGIPYDYCLRPGLEDARCTIGPGEPIPDDGVFVVFTTSFGGLEIEPPTTITANQPLTFTLFVREGGDTKLTAIESDSIEVTTDSGTELDADVSGDRRYITVIPRAPWVGDSGGTITVRVRGSYLDELVSRRGLVFTFEPGVGGTFDQTFVFEVPARNETTFPFTVADAPGDETGIVELYRISAPLPTILPSYNQIGFDSIHYVIGLVERQGDDIVAWGVGGTLDGGGETIVNPASDVRFPLVFRWDDGVLTMLNDEGFTIEFNGFPLPFQFFRVATTLDAQGNAVHSPWLNAKTICDEITFYGPFLQLLGFCNAETGLLDAVGGSEFRPFGDGTQSAPAGLGMVEITRDGDGVVATLSATSLRSEEHNFGILILDADTGIPVGLNYTERTSQSPDTGLIQTVSLDLSDVADVPASLRVYLMVDAYPAAVATLP